MKIKLLREGAQIPTRGSNAAAGYDLYAAIDGPVTIQPQTMQKIGSGVAIAISQPNYFGAIFARSGMATKRGLRPANAVGVIDADYRGEVIVPLYNDSDEPQTIYPGDRVAQLVFMPFTTVREFEVVDDLDTTDRGAGGFGSTGSH